MRKITNNEIKTFTKSYFQSFKTDIEEPINDYLDLFNILYSKIIFGKDFEELSKEEKTHIKKESKKIIRLFLEKVL